MKRLLFVLLALLAIPAHATSLIHFNTPTIIGLPCTMADGSKLLCPGTTLLDSTGAAFGTSGNPVFTAPGANSYAATAALASNKVVKNSAGTLAGFTVVGDATAIASAWYVLVFDATSLPGDGAVTPVQCIPANAGQSIVSVSEPTGGVSFATGIVVGISSSGCFTQTTLGAHAFISGVYR